MNTIYDRVNPIVRWGFYGFVFSIPLEYPDRTIPVELHTITGAIFLVITCFQARVCFRRPPAAFWLFAIYLYVWTTLGVLGGIKYESEFITMFLIYAEVILLFWTTYNLMRDEVIAKNVLLVFALSCGLMAALLRSGYMESTSELGVKYAGRLSGMGQDPNILAGNLALGILILVGLAYGANKRTVRFYGAYLLLIPLMGICIAYSGSRGGFIALGAGLLAFTLKPGNVRSRVTNFTGVLLLLLFFLWASYHTGTIWNRYQKSLEEGSMAAREEIFPDAWQMFLEKPLMGWGPINNKYELATRTAEEGREKRFRDTHNLWLEVLTATGLLGAVPFFAGLWICLRAAWKARVSTWGIIPIVLMTTVLMQNISMNWVQSKHSWLVLAFALASSRSFARLRRVIARPVATDDLLACGLRRAHDARVPVI